MSAVKRILNIPELLELILLHLPLRTLLHAQKVCHRFRNIIKSPALQKALFFEPASEPLHKAFPDEHKPTLNPLLYEAFYPFFTQIEEQLDLLSIWDFKTEDWSGGGHWGWMIDLKGELDPSSSAEAAHAFQRRDAYHRPEASWQKMLVLQPPVRAIEIWSVVRSRRGEHGVRERFDFCADAAGDSHQPQQLTMGLLYDLVGYGIREYANFGLTWRMFDNQEDMSRNTGESHEFDACLKLASTRQIQVRAIVPPEKLVNCVTFNFLRTQGCVISRSRPRMKDSFKTDGFQELVKLYSVIP